MSKAALFHDLINERELDLLALTESWVTTDTPAAISDDIPPPDYSALHAPRQTVHGGPGRGGGVAVVFRDSVVVQPHPVANKLRTSTCDR